MDEKEELKHQATTTGIARANLLAAAAKALGSQTRIEPIGNGRFRVYWSPNVSLRKG